MDLNLSLFFVCFILHISQWQGSGSGIDHVVPFESVQCKPVVWLALSVTRYGTQFRGQIITWAEDSKSWRWDIFPIILEHGIQLELFLMVSSNNQYLPR